jgi:UDP-N-acetyl-D-glucosamine dehydrogenase
LKDAKIFILGVAYKKDIDDMRESPALKIIQLLRKQGANITYHDPFIPVIEPHGGSTLHLESVPLTDEVLANADSVLILTDHSNVDYERVVANAKLVVDTRNATKNVLENREKIVKI